MSAVKISVVGAGSASFSLGLVKDTCLTQGLAGSLISFMDVDAERLGRIVRVARRYATQLGVDLSFEATTDLRESLQDADFVINTAALLSHEKHEELRDVRAKHGYYRGQGYHISYHGLKLIETIVRAMEAICPDGWLIQYGNPVFDCCTLMTRESDIRIVGKCHGHTHIRMICEDIGIDPDRVTWQAPGLNHNIWLTHFVYDGKDAYTLLDEWIATKAERYWNDESPTLPATPERDDEWFGHDMHRKVWAIDLSRAAVFGYRMYGLLPLGDGPRHLGWWMNTDLATKQYWLGKPYGGPDSELGWPVYLEWLDANLAEIARLVNDPQADAVAAIGVKATHEEVVPIIDALINNNAGHFQVNVPNNGILNGIPDDVVVEVPAFIDQKGVQPYVASQLPRNVMLNEIMPHWLRMERALHAYKSGDRAMLLWGILDSNFTQSYDQALAMLEEVMELEGLEDMAAHHKWPEKW